MTGSKIKLKGRSGHGKNIVRIHGDTWHVLTRGIFRGKPSMLLVNVETDDVRWVFIEGDTDFDWEVK